MNKTAKINLDEISLIRVIMVVLLVVYHSFAMYCGGWEPVQGLDSISTYWWIGKVSYSSLLETFVFISGYIYGYQIYIMKWDCGLDDLIRRKLKRLIIPSVLFSILYLTLVRRVSFMELSISTPIDILSGIGHLWFLPMLFWCFIIQWILYKSIRSNVLAICLTFGLSLVCFLPLPLGVSHMMKYVFFFNLGFVCVNIRDSLLKLSTLRIIILIGASFLLVFYVATIYLEDLNVLYKEQNNIINRIFILVEMQLIRNIYAVIGVSLIYGLSAYVVSKCKLSTFVLKIGNYCFGVYIFQQFILMWLYRDTDILNHVGSYGLPLVGFVVSLFGSLFLTYLLKSCKFGKNLI